MKNIDIIFSRFKKLPPLAVWLFIMFEELLTDNSEQEKETLSIVPKTIIAETLVPFNEICDTQLLELKAEKELNKKKYGNQLPYKVFWAVSTSLVLITVFILSISLSFFIMHPLFGIVYLILCSLILILPIVSFYLTKKWLKRQGIYQKDLKKRMIEIFKEKDLFSFIDDFKLDCYCDAFLIQNGLISIKSIEYTWDDYYYSDPFQINNKYYRLELWNSTNSNFILKLVEVSLTFKNIL